MHLGNPIALILLAPLAVLMIVRPLPTQLIRIFRAITLILLVLALCQVQVQLPSNAAMVVAVVDRSQSMPTDNDARALEAIDLLQRSAHRQQWLGVVAFAQSPSVEHLPQPNKFASWSGTLRRDASNLGQAIDAALAVIPPETTARLLVLSDGQLTDDAQAAVARAAERGVPIDYRLTSRSPANDLAISEFRAPISLHRGESFTLTAHVRTPAPMAVAYELARGSVVIARGNKSMTTGINRLVFRDVAENVGAQTYTLSVTGAEGDPIRENNHARCIVGVEGPTRVLLAGDHASPAFTALLRNNGFDVDAVAAKTFAWTLDALAGHSAVILENVPSQSVGTPGMGTLAEWVRQTGAGLMTTGGKNAYAAGGYFKSPLDPILPVSMELRQEHRKLSLGIVVAIDRSGSMAAPAGGGRRKIDLANISAVQVLDLLSPSDWFGMLAVDSSAHTIVPLCDANAARAQRNTILSIDSMGGGIFIYEALSNAAEMLLACQAKTRHIILFADAADSEEPGQYVELLANCTKENITVSVIGMGTEADCDANLLKDVAKRGGGRIFFTNDVNELPRIFAQDTFLVARSTFIDEPTSVALTPAFHTISSTPFPQPPNVGGYNLCYTRPEAQQLVTTIDEYKAPLLAAWQVGLGRSLSYTGEIDGEFTGPIGEWNRFNDFVLTLARWTVGQGNAANADRVITQQIVNNTCRIQVHLDPERSADADTLDPARLTILRQAADRPIESETIPLRWQNADLLWAEVPLVGDEILQPTVSLGSHKPQPLAPMCLPYCPEFRPVDSDTGRIRLDQIARTTGGIERIQPAEIWKDLVTQPRIVDITVILLLLAMITMLLEVLERRTSLIASLISRITAIDIRRLHRASETSSNVSTDTPSTSPSHKSTTKPVRKDSVHSSHGDSGQPSTDAKPSTDAPAAKDDDGPSAFNQARHRANRRTQR